MLPVHLSVEKRSPKAGNSLAAMGSEKSRFPIVRNQLTEGINTCPIVNGQEAQRLPSRGSRAHTGV